MRILADADDAQEFVNLIECLCLGVLAQYAPASFVLVKIDNWFGSKWLGFSGKALGAVGVWNKPSHGPVRVPPFVPNRVVRQRRFSGHPDYDEVSAGRAIHIPVTSEQALRRKAALIAPDTALAWYSGNTAHSGRGALMSYVPSRGSHWVWYADWKKGKQWELHECWDIKPEQIAKLTDTRNNTGLAAK